ncbi:DUF3397 family protein [Mangrovibacillus cuniculi]|uniref:DUF3397 domain-containing protein n=1 Tax=Mangrovibacillus cuniculi TaxID=2593652 RepID=A0A7S8CA62_9BACI|nr:DUF3397 family protein [Mangrovibacillus cuniculi]QPC46247.1 DUF3397 domain-containing protein [Mangrovibacillus cuniculi]
MENIVIFILFLFIIAPLFVYIIVFTIAKQLTKKHKKSVTLALDMTTVFLVVGVTVLFSSIFQYPLIWWSMLLFLLLVVILAVHQRLTKIDIIYPVILKRVWRIHFLVYAIAHFLLIITGIVFSIRSGL